MFRSCFILLCLLCSVLPAQIKTTPQWKYELEEEPKSVVPLRQGEYVFLSADEYAWVYETATGKKIWSVKIAEYDDHAVHKLLNDSLYLVSNDDTLLCYQILADRLLWKKRYTGIEQDRFNGMNVCDTVVVCTFDNTDLGINLVSGAELWRINVEHEQSLSEKGTVSALLLEKVQRYLIFTGDDEIDLYSLQDGKKMYSRKNSAPNPDLIGQKRAWYYLPADQRYVAVLTEEGILALDTETGKESVYRKMSISDQYNPFIPTDVGCAIAGDEKFVHVNFETGSIAEVPIDIDKLRNILVAMTDSGEVMLLSLEDKMIGVSLADGKMLWQTPPKLQQANGFIHRYIVSDTNYAVVSYLDPSDDLKLYIMSIDLLSGKIQYRTLVAHADESLPKRILPLPPVAMVNDADHVSFGYDNAGFDYQYSVYNSSVRILIHTGAEMLQPGTDRDGGEGIVIVNAETGSVSQKNYVKIASDLSFGGGFASLAKPIACGSLVILPGDKSLLALDSATGVVRWMLIEQDLNKSHVIDMAMIGSVLYIRTGGSRFTYEYHPKKEKIETKKVWEEEEYTLIAVDTSDGKIYWKKEFEADPSRVFPLYSIANYSDERRIFYADEKYLYAYSLLPGKGDSTVWAFEFSDSGVGALPYDELFQKSTYWKEEKNILADAAPFYSDSGYTFVEGVIAGERFGSQIARVLQVNYRPATKTLIAIGDDGIASIDPNTGIRKWYREWDYGKNAVQHRPLFINDCLFYFVEGKLVLLNLKNGKLLWEVKADNETGVFVITDKSAIVTVYKDEVAGYIIPQ